MSPTHAPLAGPGMQVRCEHSPDLTSCSYCLCEPLKETCSESHVDLSLACKRPQMMALHFASFFKSPALDEAASSSPGLSYYYRAHRAIAFGGQQCPRSMRHQSPCPFSASCCDLCYQDHFFHQTTSDEMVLCCSSRSPSIGTG